jgi:hypothetical protein
MIKIKLYENEIHRNETTFRPWVFIRNELREVGIDLILDGDSYDILMVGQATIANKKIPLQESVDMGLEKLSKISGDYIIVDGQDAPTLIGTVDVFRHVYKDKNCKLFLKTSYYKDFDLYKKHWNLGRMYWGKPGPCDDYYCVPDIDKMKHKMKLTGFNWLSTVTPNWNIPSRGKLKYNDVFAMFTYPMGKEVYEHGQLQSKFYDEFRRPLVEKLEPLKSKYKIAMLKDGQRVPLQEFYQALGNSKIVIVPLGYGEMMPRDVETSMFGNVLLKNDMSHIETIPNIYVDNGTYIAMKWDYSDLEEKIEFILSKWEHLVNHLAIQMQIMYESANSVNNRIIYLYNLLKDLDGIGVE